MLHVICFFILLLFSACNSRGYTPHYILTDSPETKQAVNQCKEDPQLIEDPLSVETKQ